MLPYEFVLKALSPPSFSHLLFSPILKVHALACKVHEKQSFSSILTTMYVPESFFCLFCWL